MVLTWELDEYLPVHQLSLDLMSDPHLKFPGLIDRRSCCWGHSDLYVCDPGHCVQTLLVGRDLPINWYLCSRWLPYSSIWLRLCYINWVCWWELVWLFSVEPDVKKIAFEFWVAGFKQLWACDTCIAIVLISLNIRRYGEFRVAFYRSFFLVCQAF